MGNLSQSLFQFNTSKMFVAVAVFISDTVGKVVHRVPVPVVLVEEGRWHNLFSWSYDDHDDRPKVLSLI